MKRSRFGARDRLSRDAAELQRLAIGLSESGSKLEDSFWDTRLAELTKNLIHAGAEDDLTTAMDRLFEANPRAHDELANTVESQAETHTLQLNGQDYDIQLFASPILAWSRYTIPSGPLGVETLKTLKVQLGAHVFAAHTRLALVDYLFSPDQLPRSFCDTWQLTRELGEKALAGSDHLHLDPQGLPETNRFLSDVRYLVGVMAVPRGNPLFRWNEADGNRESALAAWVKQGSPSLEPLLTGCAYQPLLADAYHSACRQADRDSRPYAVKASVAFLQTTLGLMPEEMRAVVTPCYDQRLEEYRIGLCPRDRDTVYHGVVWALLGAEDENTDIVSEIDATLRECGMKDIIHLDHRLPMEFCDDCGAPFFPTAEGELVHAEMPEQSDPMPQTLH